MQKELHIRYTSDVHGFFFPTRYADTEPREMGLARLITEFPHDEDTLILDGGDTLQGSPLVNYYHHLPESERLQQLPQSPYGTHPVAAIMNLAGYQYITLGNHDFNYGLEELDCYLNQLNAVCLCANVRDRAGKLPIQSYAIHTLKNGLRIGLVGVTSHFIRTWEKKETVDQLIIEDAFEKAREMYEQIRPLCDFSILIYHGGYECDLDTHRLCSDTGDNQACQICEEIGYDLVLSGHQHMAQPGLKYGKSYTLQPPQRAKGACAVDILFPEGSPAILSSTILPATSAPSSEALALLQPLEDRVQHWLDQPAGHLDRPLPPIDHLEAALKGSLVANFINQVQLDLSGAQISSCSLPNEYKGFRQAPTIRDIVSTYTYPNTLVLMSISGEDLKRYIEHTAEYFALDEAGEICLSDRYMVPKVQHYNYDFFSGIDYTIDVSRPVGDRVTRITIQGEPIHPDVFYSLCVNSFRALGSSDYDMLPGQKVLKDIQVEIPDAMTDYLLNRDVVNVDTHLYSTILPEHA